MDDGVIDSLKVALELDPSKFTEGQDKVRLSSKKTKDQLSKDAQELETKGKQGAEFFNQMASSALKLGAILLGGVGLDGFIKNSISSGSAAGYMAKNIGVSVKDLTKFQNVVRQVGGDVSSVGPALLGLSQALTTIQLRGKGSADLISAFQFLGITDFVDRTTGKLKTVAQLLPEIQKGLSRLTPAQAFNIGTTLGLTPDIINALISPNFQKFFDNSEKIGSATQKQVESLQHLISMWGQFEGSLENIGYGLAEKIDGPIVATASLINRLSKALSSFDKQAISDIGAAFGSVAGILTGVAAGSLFGPIGIVIGAILGGMGGAIGGGVIGEAIRRTAGNIAPPESSSGAPEAVVVVPSSSASRSFTVGGFRRGELSSPSQRKEEEAKLNSFIRGLIGVSPTTTAPVSSPLDKLFGMIQTLEGGKVYSKTPTGNSKDPFAYGKNQITLGTALQYDKSATATKLLDARYNDDLARKIQADYYKRYNGNLDAIAIAYHNGPAAADRFVANGGDTSKLQNFGPQSAAYLERERALASISSSSNSTTNTSHIGAINVNAPQASNSREIASSIRAELENNQLLNQANAGPQ